MEWWENIYLFIHLSILPIKVFNDFLGSGRGLLGTRNF